MIYKYRVNVGDNFLKLPKGSRFISTHAIEDLFVWVELGKGEDTTYAVEVIGTGWDYDTSTGTPLGSAFQGCYVWHIFYKELI